MNDQREHPSSSPPFKNVSRPVKSLYCFDRYVSHVRYINLCNRRGQPGSIGRGSVRVSRNSTYVTGVTDMISKNGRWLVPMLRVSVTEVDTVQPPSRRSELAHPISPAPHNPTRAHSPTSLSYLGCCRSGIRQR